MFWQSVPASPLQNFSNHDQGNGHYKDSHYSDSYLVRVILPKALYFLSRTLYTLEDLWAVCVQPRELCLSLPRHPFMHEAQTEPEQTSLLPPPLSALFIVTTQSVSTRLVPDKGREQAGEVTDQNKWPLWTKPVQRCSEGKWRWVGWDWMWFTGTLPLF